MTERLRVRWRGELYDVAVCLDPAARALAQSQWVGGIVELSALLDPDRPSAFPSSQKRGLAAMVLRALGEPLPPSRLASLPMADPMPAPSAGSFAPVTARAIASASPVARREQIDHAYLQALAKADRPAARELSDGVRKVVVS